MLKSLINFYLSILNKLTWIAPFLGRISVGYVFLLSGWGKLHNLDKVISFFASLGIPAPHLQAPLVAVLEFGGGGLLILGLFTRIIAAPLAVIMAVAVLTAKIEDIDGINSLFSTYEYLFIVILIWLGLSGPGSISLDKILFSKWKEYFQ